MTLPNALTAEVSDFVAAKLGLNFPPNRWTDLERALQPAAREMGFDQFEPFARWLLRTPLEPQHIDRLVNRLTVGETYFFREPQAFAALRDHFVPRLIAARGGRPTPQLRVWSAGCCTGEEAYSLAIFLERECPELRDWRIRIVGTDVNPHFLRKARAGIYRGWSFRNAPPWLKSGYFADLGGDRFELREDIKHRVSFSLLNLAEDIEPSPGTGTSGVDLIFCRNVLMYFSPGHVRRALEGFHRSLAEGGCLVVGVCETSPSLAPGFQANYLPGLTLYRKRSRAGAEPTAPLEIAVREPSLPEDFPRETTAVSIEPEPPAKAPAPSVQAQIAHAQEWFDRGDYAAAAARLQQVLTEAPLEVDAATLLARAFANQGNLPEARRAIERALAADRLRAPSHYLCATILQEMGEIERASVAFETALYLDPDFVLAHMALAELARRAGRPDRAGRHFAHALRVLRRQRPDQAIAESGGMTADRLIAMIGAMRPTNVPI